MEGSELLREFDWTQSEYFVTACELSYFKNPKPVIPNYKEFIKIAKEYVDAVDIAIGRDLKIY